MKTSSYRVERLENYGRFGFLGKIASSVPPRTSALSSNLTPHVPFEDSKGIWSLGDLSDFGDLDDSCETAS